MKPSLTLAMVAVAGLSDAFRHQLHSRDMGANDYYTLELDLTQTTPDQVANRLGLRYEGQLGQLDDVFVFSAPRSEGNHVDASIRFRRRRKRALDVSRDPLDAVGNYHKQKLRQPWTKRHTPPSRRQAMPHGVRAPQVADANVLRTQSKVISTLDLRDPIFKDQWHLINTIQPGNDVNVTDVWLSGVTGKNATVAIVDDGLDMTSDDLKDNYYAAGSYDFNDKGPEPKPRLSDDKHGTRCAGEVAAVRNDVCGIGVAFDAKVSGIRILSKIISDEDEAVALNYDYHNNHIYSCSWGPPDDGRSMDAPGWLIKKAIQNGVQQGRRGLGSIFVFASGNGAQFEDNCNFDGYTNSIYSITVGAIDRHGEHPYYSEKCSAQLVVAYSSGGGDAIHTTDVGKNTCYSGHGGTSAAAPLGAGILALALEVRWDLSWRDIQYIAMEAAVPVDLQNPDLGWQTTAIGKKFSHSFGYGKLDAWRLVDTARNWKKVKPQAWHWSPWIHVNQDIPQGNTGLKVDYVVSEQMLKDANVERLEHVTVTMNAKHTRRGDLSVDLISPSGVVSHLATTRKFDSSTTGYNDWTFMTVAHWGEKGVGTWSLIIKDSVTNDDKGTLVDFHLKFWGESIDASKTSLLPIPGFNEDADHTEVATTLATGVSTSVSHNSDPGPTITEKPSDHPDRPTKPTDASNLETMPYITDGGDPTDLENIPSITDVTNLETMPFITDISRPTATSTGTNAAVLGFLPTFGASSRSVAWIYGSLGVITAFCIALGSWLLVVRRRRQRGTAHDDYEFEPLHSEEADALTEGSSKKRVGGVGGRKRRTRGGELYDAFADVSDDDNGDDDEFRDLDDGDSPSGSGGTYDAAREKAAAAAVKRSGNTSPPDTEHHVIGDDDDDEDEDEDEEEKEKENDESDNDDDVGGGGVATAAVAKSKP